MGTDGMQVWKNGRMPLGLAGAVHAGEKGSGLLGLRNEPEFGLKMSLKMSIKKNRPNKIK